MKKHFLLKLFATVMLICLSMAMLVACEDVQVQVTFIVDDEVYAVVNLQDGNTVEMPEDPKKEDCVFGGWYLDKDIWKQPFFGKVEDTTVFILKVYARWVVDETQCNHMWSQWTIGVEPTCSAEGKQGRYCLRCNKTEVEDIEKLAHTEEIIPAVEATCYSEGSTEGKKCSVCNEILVAPQPIDKLDHNYGDWITDKEANCVKAGSKHKVCQNEGCTDRVDEDIPALEHDFELGVCTRCGALDSNYGSQGLAYTLNADGESYSVTGIGTCTDTDVVIPAVHNGKPVTIIGNQAFDDCSQLTSVVFPNSVTTIGSEAFFGCSGLTSITIPHSVTYIGFLAFSGCHGLTSIIIPNSVTYIDFSPFAGCYNIESLTVEEGNANYHSKDNCIIGTQSKVLISGCKNSIIPDDGSVTSIGSGAFKDCYSLTNITIPNSVISIRAKAFSSCSLTSIIIPNSVTSIDYCAFEACTGLTSITIPNDGSVTSIYEGAFSFCTGLTSITIPDSVTSIGERAFFCCSGLTSITIPDNVTSIGSETFVECRGLTSITIGNGVTSIGESAFGSCDGLTSITIPNSVTSIGLNAFNGCKKLSEIKFDGTVEEWNAIEKGNNWNYNVPAEKVICKDGEVEL